MAAYALTWMPDVLRAAGLRVTEISGWQNRGHGNVGDIRGVLLHHTAGPATGNFPSQNVIVDGRAGLPGPLANLGLARDGTWIVIAAGLAYHAGAGYVSWCGRNNGNNHLIGIEAESTGRGDWTAAQRTSYPRGVAALLRHLRLGSDRALAHKEWAPGRKIDPAGWPGDMAGFRADVAAWLIGRAGVLMALSDDEQHRLLEMVARIHEQLNGSGSKSPESGFPGWPVWDGSDRRLTVVDMLRETHREVSQRLEARDGSGRRDTLLGHVLNLNADLTAVSNGDSVDEDALAEKLASTVLASIRPVLREEIAAALGEDNAGQADAIVDRIAERLAA